MLVPPEFFIAFEKVLARLLVGDFLQVLIELRAIAALKDRHKLHHGTFIAVGEERLKKFVIHVEEILRWTTEGFYDTALNEASDA